jgi:hypothetical protein
MTLHVLITPPPTDCGFPTVPHPNKLPPWSRVLPEKITGPQVVKKFHAFCGTRKFITTFQCVHDPLLLVNRRISPSSRPREMFRSILSFYCEKLLAPKPNSKLVDHLFSAVRHYLFNISAATLHIGGRPSIRNLRARHVMMTRTYVRVSWRLPSYENISRTTYSRHLTRFPGGLSS